MKERPILFSGPMVRALLDGSKTQTRRIAKEFAGRTDLDAILRRFPHQNGCPYGKPGDRLWVREAWSHDARTLEECRAAYEDALAGGTFAGGTYGPYYRATETAPETLRWRPSIHMPRWASRILLEIVSVRVERLQDISEADAIAEGCKNSLHLPGGRFANENFAHLWWSINGDGAWEVNPWVWVVEFRRVQP
jgi:hypothetical protein